MVVFFAEFGVRSPLAVPPAPTRPSGGCFGPDTPIVRLGGSTIPMSKIRPGTVLVDGAIVTSTMCIDTGYNQVFSLYGINVTGTHIVKRGDDWIYVRDHPDAVRNFNYTSPYVYCMNTSTKYITSLCLLLI